MGDGETDPMLTEVGPEAEEMMASLNQAIEDAELGLQGGCVSENVDIVFIEPKGLSIRFERFLVVFLPFLNQTEDVPADM